MNDFHQKRRTRPCVYYQQGKCNRPNCNFSHDIPFIGVNYSALATDRTPSDLSPPPSLQTPRSPDDSHPPYPTHIRPSVLRTRPCKFYAKGRCTAGDACRWSHDENVLYEEDSGNATEDQSEYVPNGYKLVHRSYRTQPCARFEKGHCSYGDQCNFIHTAPSPRLQVLQNEATYASSAPTPNARPSRDLNYFGSPASLIMNMKSHSQHHSPASALGSLPALGRSLTHSPALANSALGRSPVVGNRASSPTRMSNAAGTATLTHSPLLMSRSNSLLPHTPPITASSSLPTSGMRELPPPSFQSRLSGTNWGMPAASTAKSAVATASPSLVAAADWSHPANNLNVNPSPFMLTFGEIGPTGNQVNGTGGTSGYASPIPKGLGLNAAATLGSGNSIAIASPRLNGGSFSSITGNGVPGTASPLLVGTVVPGANGISSGTTSAFTPSAMTTPSLVFGSTANINTTFASASTTDVATSHDQPRRSRLPSFADTEPDFPSIINYSDMGDYLGEVEDLEDDPTSYAPDAARVLDDFTVDPNASSRNGLGAAYDEDTGRWQGPPIGYAGYVQPYPDDQSFRLSYRTRRCKYFVAGSHCPAGNNCTFIHDPEALSRPNDMPISDYPLQSQNPEEHPLYRTRECKYHLAGRCHQEGDCAFKHTGPAGQGREYDSWEGFTLNLQDYEASPEDRATYRTRPCKWYLKGNCFHGDNCTYLHDPEYLRPACIFWKGGNGHCMNGDSCRFSHDVQDEQQTSADGSNAGRTTRDASLSGQESDSIGATSDVAQGLASLPRRASLIAPLGETLPVTTATQLPVLMHTNADEEEELLGDVFEEPYGGPGLSRLVDGRGTIMNGSSALGRLMVDDRAKMELVVSEGEEEESDEDIIVLRPAGSPAPAMDKRESTAIEGLFNTMSISTSVKLSS